MNKSRYISIFLAILFVIAFFLRWYLMPENLFFGPEQGRDLLVVKEIALGQKLTLIGSKTDVEGVFHGPSYYYLAVLPFIISRGDPLVISLTFVMLHSLAVLALYAVGKNFYNKEVGLITAVLFTFSFGSIIYARWLSNPPFSILLSTLLLYYLYRYIKGTDVMLIVSAAILGFLIQMEFLNLVLFAPFFLLMIPLFVARFRICSKRTLIPAGLLFGAISIGSFVLFDLKHDLLITNNLLNLVRGNTGYYIPYSHAIGEGFKSFSLIFSKCIFPFSSGVAGIVIILMGIFLLLKFYSSAGSKLLLLWLVVPVAMLIILKHSILEHYLIALVPVFLILTAVIIYSVYRKTKFVGSAILILLVLSNLFYGLSNLSSNKNVFFQSTQSDLKYSDQLAVVDEIYGNAVGRSFEVQAYTIPYWIQDAWEYLFWQYGEKKYGYGPVKEKSDVLFVIIQPDPSSQQYQDNWLKDTVSKWGELESSQEVGALTLQTLIPN